MYIVIDFIINAQTKSELLQLEYNFFKKYLNKNNRISYLGFKQIEDFKNIKNNNKNLFYKKYNSYDFLCSYNLSELIETGYHIFRDIKSKLYILPTISKKINKLDNNLIDELERSTFNLNISTKHIYQINKLDCKFKNFIYILLNLINTNTDKENLKIAIMIDKPTLLEIINYFPNINILNKTSVYGSSDKELYNLSVIKAGIEYEELLANYENKKFSTSLNKLITLKKSKYITKKNKINLIQNIIINSSTLLGTSYLLYKLINYKRSE